MILSWKLHSYRCISTTLFYKQKPFNQLSDSFEQGFIQIKLKELIGINAHSKTIYMVYMSLLTLSIITTFYRLEKLNYIMVVLPALYVILYLLPSTELIMNENDI